MKPRGCCHAMVGREREPSHGHRRFDGFLKRWFLANSLVSGVLALCWVLLRSGSKPSRFAYPCQQAALSAATLAFGAPLVAALVAARRHLAAGLRSPVAPALAGAGLLATAGLWGYSSRAGDVQPLTLGPSADYRAQVFQVIDCPPDPAGDRFLGLDNLITLMGREGLKFYQSTTESLIAGPEGIIAADDVVIVKINYQWGDRGGTNTDVLRGLIRRIADHPETFTGEVVVCENTQSVSSEGLDRNNNNAQDTTLSPHDVVMEFQTEGFNVSQYIWTQIRNTQVTEYSTGNMADGYVRYDYNAQLQGRISYPKFRTDYGTYISLKHGIWDTVSQTYDREGLKFINVPVLKSHGAVYGITASVKHYMGVVSGALDTNSHSAIRYGLLGALLGEIRPADLNIIDAIWVNADPYDGPWTAYSAATRLDTLIAGLDPVAADIWAAKNVLVPAFYANGFTPPWPEPSADPDDPASDFRQYLDASMSRLLAAGYDATNDTTQIDLFSGNGGAGDYTGDGAVSTPDYEQFESCFTGENGGPVGQGCEAGDFDDDGDIDCADWVQFLAVWTDTGAPPELPQCRGGEPIPAVSDWGMIVMSLLLLCAVTIVLSNRATTEEAP